MLRFLTLYLCCPRLFLFDVIKRKEDIFKYEFFQHLLDLVNHHSLDILSTAAKEVMLSVLSVCVCEQDYKKKTTGPIFIKLGGNAEERNIHKILELMQITNETCDCCLRWF